MIWPAVASADPCVINRAPTSPALSRGVIDLTRVVKRSVISTFLLPTSTVIARSTWRLLYQARTAETESLRSQSNKRILPKTAGMRHGKPRASNTCISRRPVRRQRRRSVRYLEQVHHLLEVLAKMAENSRPAFADSDCLPLDGIQLPCERK